jgi:MoaA/NifB/PqqE/SkfB family radical SAM enzyme
MCSAHNADPFGGAAINYDDMADDLFESLRPMIESARAILFGGNGEPFLTRGVEDRVARIRELNPRVEISSYSNGLRFASKRFCDRVLSDVDRLMLSVNGPESYEEIMVDGKFSKLRQALANIADHRRRTGRPRNWSMEFVMMRANVRDIVPMAELAREFGADHVHYKNYWVNSEEEKSESLHHNPELAQAMRDELVKARRVGQRFVCAPWPALSYSPGWAARLGLERLWRRLGTAMTLLLHDRAALAARLQRFPALGRLISWAGLAPEHPTPPCQMPWMNLQITEHGRALFCCAKPTYVGDLNTQTIEEVWNGPEAQRYREGLRTGRFYKGCASCHLTVGSDPVAFEKIG